MFTASHKRNVLTNATKIEIIMKMAEKLQQMLHRTILEQSYHFTVLNEQTFTVYRYLFIL
jgi:hypothetical protein